MDMNFIWLSIVSLLLMAIAIPLCLQKVKPNRWYGVRTARTLNDDGRWYRVNRLYGIFSAVGNLRELASGRG